MKLISEEVTQSEFLVEQNDKGRKITRSKVSFYNLTSKIEMEEFIQKKFWIKK